MEKFEIGDEIEVINDGYLPHNDVKPDVKKGEKHFVKEIIECKCGLQHIDIGLISGYSYVSCYSCDERLLNGHAIHWCSATRFIKTNHPIEEIEKAIS